MSQKSVPSVPKIISYEVSPTGVLQGVRVGDFKILTFANYTPELRPSAEPVKNKPGPKKGFTRKPILTPPDAIRPAPVPNGETAMTE